MNWNLRNRFLIPTLVAMCVVLGTVTYTSFTLAEEALTESMMEQAAMLTKNIRTQLSVWVTGTQQDINQLGEHPVFRRLVEKRGDQIGNVTEALNILNQFQSDYGIYEGIGLFDKNGTAIAYTIPGTTGKLNVAERQYFKDAMRGQATVSDALTSIVSERPIVVVAVPYRLYGEVHGVFAGAVELKNFSESFVDSVRLGQNGYAFLMAKSGYVAAHPDQNSILKVRLSDNAWGKEMQQKKNGTIQYQWRGIRKFVSYRTEPHTGWVIGVAANEEDIFSSIETIRTSNVLFSAAGLLVMGVVVFFIVKSIVASLTRCVVFAEAVASGDLEQQLHISRGDEIGALAKSLNTMVGRLKEMIFMAENKTREAEEQSDKAQIAMKDAEQARQQAENAKREGMLQAASQLEGIVEGVTGASDELFRLVEEAAGGSQIQRERALESATAIEEMNATVLEVAKNAGEAAEHAASARKEAEDGSAVVTAAVDSITEVERHSGHLKQSLNELGTRAENIESVMTVITDIADQTNLLALNAAIEAARAGEAGRGFAVVADEVRKLAEKTMHATKEVDDAINAIQDASRENVKGMEQATVAVTRSTEYAKQSGDALRSIVDIVVANADQVSSIAAASEQQSAASEQISRGSEEVNRIATETAESMTHAKGAVDKLLSMTNELQELIQHLKRQ